MLVRLWTTTFNADQKERLVDYANRVSLPVLASRPGNRGVLFFSDADVWTTLTLWDDQACIDKLAVDAEYTSIVEGIMALNVLGTEQATTVWSYCGGGNENIQRRFCSCIE